MRKLTNEEIIEGYKTRIRTKDLEGDKHINAPFKLTDKSEKLKKAETDLKDGRITKEDFLRVLNNNTEYRQMTMDEFNNLPMMDSISECISCAKTTSTTNAGMLKAYLGPYRSKQQIVKDDDINVAAIIVGSIVDDKIRYHVEKVDIIKE